jgi:hypothetical protein
LQKSKRETPATCYERLFESEHQRKRKRKKEKGSPLRETSAAYGHGHVMVFCLLAWEERKCVFRRGDKVSRHDSVFVTLWDRWWCVIDGMKYLG